MCGIFGYVGSGDAFGIGLAGIKRLEYRGYDSAGFALATSTGIQVEKAEGRIGALEAKLNGATFHGSASIWHTRWATHGKPSEENAHPHGDCGGRIFVVHNGIIENYSQLRHELISAGHTFRSETDTEVLPHLIEAYYEGDLVAAVRRALRRVVGTFGLVVLSADHPSMLVAARMASPLVIGIGRGEHFVASDVAALLRHTRDVVTLENEDLAVIESDRYSLTNFSAEAIRRSVETVEWTEEEAERGGYEHFTLKEIMEQPRALEDSLRGRSVISEGQVKLGGLAGVEDALQHIDEFLLLACGTAYYAGLFGGYVFEDLGNVKARVELASEFRYRRSVLTHRDAVLGISQSGETIETIEALREARMRGMLTLGIVNRVGSLLTKETAAGVYNHVGPEIGVASTKAFLSQMAILTLLSVCLGRQRGMSFTQGREVLEALALMPGLVEKTLALEETVRKTAERLSSVSDFLYLGRKYQYPVALEGALKLKELAYVSAEGYPGAEMKHGPLALIPDYVTVALCPQDSVYGKMRSNIREITTRGGRVIAIATEGDTDIAGHVEEVWYVPSAPEFLLPMVTVVPLQLFAYHMAVLRGHDPDHPRNLAKSVTVE